jgi:hypothetical protein
MARGRVRCVTVCIHRRCRSAGKTSPGNKKGLMRKKDTTITDDEGDVEDVYKETGVAAASSQPKQNHDLDTKQGSPVPHSAAHRTSGELIGNRQARPASRCA